MPTHPTQIRIAPSKKATLKQIALTLGYTYAGEGNISALMEAIADGGLILVQKKVS